MNNIKMTFFDFDMLTHTQCCLHSLRLQKGRLCGVQGEIVREDLSVANWFDSYPAVILARSWLDSQNIDYQVVLDIEGEFVIATGFIEGMDKSLRDCKCSDCKNKGKGKK